jgi:hypothetical protein
MLVRHVSIDDITLSGRNPEERTAERAIKELLDSIAARGIIEPLVLTASYELIDGHRRLACARSLGITHVPAILVTEDNPGALFEELNRTKRTISGREWTQVYVRGGAVPRKIRGAIERIGRVAGPGAVTAIAEHGLAIGSIDSVMGQIAHYCACSPEDPQLMPRVIQWLVDGNSAVARRAMAGNVPPQILLAAIERGAGLFMTWEVAAGEIAA